MIKLSSVSLFVFLVLTISMQTTVTSCQKRTEIVWDTIIRKDTLLLRDTVRIRDTVGCNTLMDSLVAYYNFNGGTLNDSSGNNNHIVFNNAMKTSDRFGRPNNAYKFDGASTFMRVSNSPSLSPKKISLVAIVRFDGFYLGQCHATQILKKGFQDQDNGIYGLRAGRPDIPCNLPLDVNKIHNLGYYGNNQLASITARDTLEYIKTGTWMTVVFTYDGSQARIYVNGKLKQTVNGPVPFNPNTFDVLIGRAEHPTYPYWFNGAIDEIRIYKKALCDCEIEELSRWKK